ncbi:hypothetical protein AVEN_222692-1 [Araneus ventricosus]|uniref:Uncharacterized protein n=1 Tax=Araneus ventricosus TaxID=182803 RepID=A0A4Y2AZG8_ARAVE|nr:hypothetical protein AVEN_222692-1 [Araneus ventricosus]
MSLRFRLDASSSHGDFEACVNLLQTCFTLALLSCQICCKLADLQCRSAANLLQTKIAIWEAINSGSASQRKAPALPKHPYTSERPATAKENTGLSRHCGRRKTASLRAAHATTTRFTGVRPVIGDEP